MSDARLRDLERRWKETGTPEHEAAYLLERVRVGGLTRERLELAATCGHTAATIAVAIGFCPSLEETARTLVRTELAIPFGLAVVEATLAVAEVTDASLTSAIETVRVWDDTLPEAAVRLRKLIFSVADLSRRSGLEPASVDEGALEAAVGCVVAALRAPEKIVMAVAIARAAMSARNRVPEWEALARGRIIECALTADLPVGR